MERLLAALQRLRNDLVNIHADFECIEACLKEGKTGYGPSLSHLQDHVRALDCHLGEIEAYCAPFGILKRARTSQHFGSSPLLEGASRGGADFFRIEPELMQIF